MHENDVTELGSQQGCGRDFLAESMAALA